jgi:hypothetical protein
LNVFAASESSIKQECERFTQYLLDGPVYPYAVRKYVQAHQVCDDFSTGDAFDLFLVRAARVHWVVTKAADGYARFFAPRTLLRKKLVLLLAILETSSPSSRFLESAVIMPLPLLLLRLAVRGLLSTLSFTAAVVVFLPAQLILRRARS